MRTPLLNRGAGRTGSVQADAVMFAQTLPEQAEHQSIELFAGESDLCSEGVRHPVKRP